MEGEDEKNGEKQKKKKKSGMMLKKSVCIYNCTWMLNCSLIGCLSASVHSELYRSFLAIHESCREFGATPSQYLSFLQVYQSIYSSKQKELTHKQQHLQVSSVSDGIEFIMSPYANVWGSHVTLGRCGQAE